MKREESSQRVVNTSDSGKVDTWEKNSAGNTTAEGHTTYNPNTGNTVDHYGNIVNSGNK